MRGGTQGQKGGHKYIRLVLECRDNGLGVWADVDSYHPQTEQTSLYLRRHTSSRDKDIESAPGGLCLAITAPIDDSNDLPALLAVLPD